MFSRLASKFLPRLPNYVQAFGALQGVSLAWKLEARIESGPGGRLSVPFQDRKLILRDSIGDRSVYWQCIVRHQYDISVFPHHFSILRKKYEALIGNRKNPLIIDGGANIGLASVYLNRMFPLAKIVAVEPDGDNLALLRQNCSSFSENMNVLQGGLWYRDASLKITNQGAGSTAFTVAEARRDEPDAVPAFCLDSLIAQDSGALLVKLDIEGAQQHLFRDGSTAWIDRTDCIILELDDWLFPWAGTSQSFFAEMSKRSFDYLLHGEHIVCFNHRLVG